MLLKDSWTEGTPYLSQMIEWQLPNVHTIDIDIFNELPQREVNMMGESGMPSKFKHQGVVSTVEPLRLIWGKH